MTKPERNRYYLTLTRRRHQTVDAGYFKLSGGAIAFYECDGTPLYAVGDGEWLNVMQQGGGYFGD